MKRRNVLIMGAAGRDFHNFNVCYRGNDSYRVVAFTAAQIPDIHGRRYPAELAGEGYPEGIPIHEEQELPQLIRDHKVDDCVFAYSDVSYQQVMSISAIVGSAGANFVLLGPVATMLRSTKPVVAVGAVRTGSGKSQTARRIIEILMGRNLRVVAVRHPMPYGELVGNEVQRFAALDDLEKYRCTVEEMEEYEPHVARGNVIYAGVDYEAILRAAEQDPAGCDVLVWDGGNNDFPFYRPDLMVTVADPHRAGDELCYYPGETTLRIADVVVINKIDSADGADIQRVRDNVARVNPGAVVVEAASPIRVANSQVIRGKKVLVIEDGPTLTHGNMRIGAGVVAARKYGAAQLVDPRAFAVGRIAETYRIYPDIGTLLPAMGYGPEQLADMEATIDRCDADAVIVATPIDLGRIIRIRKPSTRVFYDLQEIGEPNLEGILEGFMTTHTPDWKKPRER